MEYEPVIGIEVHTELKTRTKMFCDCLNDPDEKHPNVNICPICLAHPGTLPVANKEAVEKVILVGMALHAEIPEYSQFDRKNYFYPDLPKGYQISQYEHPLVKGGYLEFRLGDGTEPDIRSAEEARRFAEELQLVIRYIGASDADMEKGQMRVEANVSIRPKGTKEFGTKVELKNINSFKFVEKAVLYEIERQKKVLESGEGVIQETRGWDESKGVSVSQRIKEGATDYRYFPEPDLPPLMLDQAWLSAIRARLTELPDAKRRRFAKEYELDDKTIEQFIGDRELSKYFEEVVSELAEWIGSMGDRVSRPRAIKLVASYLTTDFQKLRKETTSAVSDTLITPENFSELVALIYEDKISSAAAKQVLELMFRTGADPTDIIREKNLGQESSQEALGAIVRDVIAANEPIVAQVKSGKTNAIQALVGAAMKASGGKGNPALLRQMIENAIQ